MDHRPRPGLRVLAARTPPAGRKGFLLMRQLMDSVEVRLPKDRHGGHDAPAAVGLKFEFECRSQASQRTSRPRPA
jgi:hypothetical protein